MLWVLKRTDSSFIPTKTLLNQLIRKQSHLHMYAQRVCLLGPMVKLLVILDEFKGLYWV